MAAATAVVWVWEGKTKSGETKKGTIEADSEDAARERLKLQQITISKIRKQGAGFKFSMPGQSIPERDIVIFTRQFATMIDAGLPLVQCLDILANQSGNKALKKVLLDVKIGVESGQTFSDALRKHPKVFDDLFCNLIAAGEVGGILDPILQRLSAYIEKAMKLKAQVKGAMTYPIAILVISVGVTTLMLTKVVPMFVKMFDEMGGGKDKLPAPTKVVIGISDWLVANIGLLIGMLIAFMVFMKFFLANPKGRKIFDTLLLRLPVIGNVLRKTVVARFTRTMGTLLSSGVPILDSMEIVAKTAGNVVVKEAIMHAREKVAEGKDVAGPLAETKVFPSMVVQMIAVGEQTGAMDSMLQKIADFYEDEVDAAVASMTALIEPFMLVFLGGIVGGLLIAMYMPIFEIAGNVKTK